MFDDETEPVWVRVIRAESVRDGVVASARMGIRPVGLTRRGGKVVAFVNRCPHKGTPLHTSPVRNGCITCPTHGYIFRVDDGSCPEHPIYGLRMIEARENEGWIELAEPSEVW